MKLSCRSDILDHCFTLYSLISTQAAGLAGAVYCGLSLSPHQYSCGELCAAVGASYSFRNKELAVVGGGDTAVEEAIYLTKYASKACHSCTHAYSSLPFCVRLC